MAGGRVEGRAASATLAGFVVWLLAPAPAIAQSIVVRVGDPPTAVVPGDTVDVPVVVDMSGAGGLDIASLTFDLAWDPARLTYVSSTPGAFGTVLINDANAGTGSLVVSMISAVGATTTFTVVTVRYVAALTQGNALISINVTDAGDALGGSILGSVSGRPLDLCVGTTGPLGDVNADDAVDIIDAQQVARFAVGLTGPPDPARATSHGDVTEDSKVDVIDAQQIARYSVGLPTPAAPNLASLIPGGCPARPRPAAPTTSTITAGASCIVADGASTSAITVQLKDANGVDLTQGGDTVTLSTTAGTLGPVVDNGDGTYTSTPTSSPTRAVATVTGTVNSDAITDDATVAWPDSLAVEPAAPSLLAGDTLRLTATRIVVAGAVPVCRGDLNNDGVVGNADDVILKADLGRTDMPPSDLNRDGVVDAADEAILLGNLGARFDTLAWSSANAAVATVDRTGLVTGVAAGTADITGTTLGVSGTVTATVTVVATVTHLLQARHYTTAPLTDAEADAILADATLVLQAADEPGDVACDVEMVRNGPVTAFTEGNGEINTQADFSFINSLAGNIKVVNVITWCGSVNPSIIGCASQPGSSFVVERYTANQEGILWAHEFGHNKGLPHRSGTNLLMNASIGPTNKVINSTECNAYRN